MRVRPSGLRVCDGNCSGWRLRLQRMHIFQHGLGLTGAAVLVARVAIELRERLGLPALSAAFGLGASHG